MNTSRMLHRRVHRAASCAAKPVTALQVAHMAQHAVEGNYVAAVAVAASWIKDGVALFLERYVEEEEER